MLSRYAFHKYENVYAFLVPEICFCVLFAEALKILKMTLHESLHLGHVKAQVEAQSGLAASRHATKKVIYWI